MTSLWQRIAGDVDAQENVTPEEVAALEREMDALLNDIGACETVSDAATHFKSLSLLQELLARLRFKYGIVLSPRLRELVREFDRPDEPEIVQKVFGDIKRGRFLVP